MTDYNSPLDIPNQLGQDFVNYGIGGSGGGGGGNVSTITYTLSPSGNQVVLTPTSGSGEPTTQVDISTLPVVIGLTNKTANISVNGISTIVNSPLITPGNIQLAGNTLTTTGSGNTATLTLNGNLVGGTASTWANFPAINNVSIPSPYNLTMNGDNVLSGGQLPNAQINANLLLGAGSSHYPDFIAYPYTFQVGSILTPANNISMRSGAGGTTIGSVQGISLQAGVDINLNATGDINLLSALTTIEGNAVITGTLTTDGNVLTNGSSEVIGNFSAFGTTELAGATTIGGATTITGETNITGDTNINGLTTINGGLVVSGVADLNGGVAIAGGMGVAGVATMNGNILQQTGHIETSNITDYASGGLNITPSGNLALTNLSSINGFPYTSGSNQPWYKVPALTDVNMNNSSIYGIARLSGYVDGNFLIDAYSSAGSTCGITLDANSGGRILMAGGAVEIDNVLNVNGDLFVGSIGTGNTITADKGNFSALSSISSINGLPYATGNVAEWSLYPADHPVVLNSEPINGVSALNVAVGQNFSINNAFTATYIQGNSLIELYTGAGGAIDLIPGVGGNVAIQNNCPLSVYAITGVSSINGAVYPPADTGFWYDIPAQANPNLNYYSLQNVGSVLGQVGGTLGINNSIAGSVAIGSALTSSITTTGSNVVNTAFYNITNLAQTGGISHNCPGINFIRGSAGVVLSSDIATTITSPLYVDNINSSTAQKLIIGDTTKQIQIGDGLNATTSTIIGAEALILYGVSTSIGGTSLRLVGPNTSINGDFITLNGTSNVINGNTAITNDLNMSANSIYNITNLLGSSNTMSIQNLGTSSRILMNTTNDISITTTGNVNEAITLQSPNVSFVANTVQTSTTQVYQVASEIQTIKAPELLLQASTLLTLQSPNIQLSSIVSIPTLNGVNTFNNIPNVAYNTMGSPMWITTYNGSANTYTNDQTITNSQSYLTLATIAGGTSYLTYANNKASALTSSIVLTNPFGDATYLNGFKVPYSGAWRLSMNLGNTYLSYSVHSIDSGRNNVLLLTNMDTQRVIGSIADSPTWYVQTNPTVGFHTINPNSGNTISQIYVLTAGVNYGWYFCNQSTWGSVDYTRLDYANTTGTERSLSFPQPYFTFEYCG
jgi:hypothetical protein